MKLTGRAPPSRTPSLSTATSNSSSATTFAPTSSSAASVITSTTSNTAPFFASPSSLTRPPSTEEHGTALTKSILEWLFLAIALVLLTSFVVFRSLQLRRRNLPLTQFFSSTSSSRPLTGRPQSIPRTGVPSLGFRSTSYPLTDAMLYPSLDPLPSAYTRVRRTRAADTDEGGRRAGPAGEDDAKDMLPAYEGGGGPPKYMELEMMDNIRTRLHLNFSGTMGRHTERPGTMSSQEDDRIPEATHEPQDLGSTSQSHEEPTAPAQITLPDLHTPHNEAQP